ncbi:MAG: ABC transporter ATP-binding protein [Bacilli bacterium]|jgi:ABC-type multidrug transport system fused ATPase/permease subunit|nr:ABC transporter ATP-binding protein [Bacilli bacterium]
MGNYQYAKDSKKNFILFLIFTILLCIIGAIVPIYSAKQLLSISEELFEQLFYSSIILFLLEIFRNTVRFIGGINASKFYRTTLKNIQISIASELLKTTTKELNKKSSGYYIERISSDAGKIADIYVNISECLTEIITNCGILISIFILNKFIFLFYLIFLIILFSIQKKKNAIYQKNDQVHRKLKEQATSISQELVRGAKDIKVLNAEENFIKEAKNKITASQAQRYKMFITNRKYNFLYNNIRDILDFSYIFLTILLIQQKIISISTAIIIYNYRYQIVYTLDYVGMLMEYLKDFNLSANRVFQIIEASEKETFGTEHLNHIKGNLEFKDVSFSYDNQIPILKKINFQIKANETVSFVGKCGAGKSTIFHLLCKLYEPTSGTISIDGKDISKLDKDSIRGNISIITQNPYIFNMSIRNNLAIIKDGLTDEEMKEACKMACLHDYIMTLPSGYDTIVGEGGVTLSGGQKQRLAIARALVQRTEIILFDEATSALDNETQKEIQTAIKNMQGEYTILMIAHRLSTVMESDRIIVLEDGEIKGAGTHKELLQKNKNYQKLYQLELKQNLIEKS